MDLWSNESYGEQRESRGTCFHTVQAACHESIEHFCNQGEDARQMKNGNDCQLVRWGGAAWFLCIHSLLTLDRHLSITLSAQPATTSEKAAELKRLSLEETEGKLPQVIASIEQAIPQAWGRNEARLC